MPMTVCERQQLRNAIQLLQTHDLPFLLLLMAMDTYVIHDHPFAYVEDVDTCKPQGTSCTE